MNAESSTAEKQRPSRDPTDSIALIRFLCRARLIPKITARNTNAAVSGIRQVPNFIDTLQFIDSVHAKIACWGHYGSTLGSPVNGISEKLLLVNW
jgi:hypothetical protein